MTEKWVQDNLTDKQLEYVADTASGLSTLEIAEKKYVSHHTVRNTLAQAKERVGASSSYNLVAVALYKGWITVDSNDTPLTFKANVT